MQSFLELCNEVRTTTDSIEIFYLKPYIGILRQRIQEKKKEQPEKTIEQLREEIIKEMRKEIYDFKDKSEELRIYWIEGDITDKFLHNPHHLKEVLEEVKLERKEGKGKDDFYLIYEFNEKKDEKNMIHQIWNSIEKGLKRKEIELDEENCRKILEVYSEERQKERIRLYVQSILDNLKILEKYGFIKHYCEKNNSNMQKIGLDKIQLTKEEFDKMFREEELKKLPLQELISLDVFYQNRLAKEHTHLCQIFYFMDQLNLWDPKKKIDYKEDIFQEIYVKKRILDRLKKIIANEKEGEKDLLKQYEKEYQQYFKTQFEEKSELREVTHDLKKEGKESQRIEDMITKIYANKSLGVGELIQELSKNTKMNWGYVPQDPEKEKNTILLAFDIKGYNLPLCVHVPKKKFVLWFKDIKRHELPIYQGNEDFKIGKDMLPINVFYPLSEKDIKEIADRCKQAKKKPGSYPYPDCMIHIGRIAMGANKNKKETILVENIINQGKRSEELEETR